MCAGADIADDDGGDWKVLDADTILGWTFFASGSCLDGWDALRQKLWKADHAQFHRPAVAQAGFMRKLMVLDCVLSRVLLRAVEPWPFSRTIANNIDALQRHMVACLVHVPRSFGESNDQYLRRRGRFASSLM